MKLLFYLHFSTKFGQQLWVTGNIDELGNNDPAKALLMDYLNEEFWHTTIEIKRKELPKNISYKYILKNENGEMLSAPMIDASRCLSGSRCATIPIVESQTTGQPS